MASSFVCSVLQMMYAEELATDRAEWRQRVAQCIHLDAG